MDFDIRNHVLVNVRNQPVPDVSIPVTVKEIGSFAFSDYSGICSLHIPYTVAEIGYHAFYECGTLEKIHVNKLNPYFSDVDGVLYDRSQNTLLCCPHTVHSVHIPASVSKINFTDAFAGCPSLEKITIDQKNKHFTLVKGILYEYNNFRLTKLVRCPVHVQQVKIPESVTEICNHAFEHCHSLQEITIPENVRKIGGYAFKHCSQLHSVHWQSHQIDSIGDSAFRFCTSLKEMILPQGTKSITAAAFTSCSSLETLVIPKSVTFAGYIAGHDTNLKNLTCHDIPVSLVNGKYASEIIYMIVRHACGENIDPALKNSILFQMFLQNPQQIKLKQYIQEHFLEIICQTIQCHQQEVCLNYVNAFPECMTPENLDLFIQTAIAEKQYEVQLSLTHLKYEKNTFTPKDWTL